MIIMIFTNYMYDPVYFFQSSNTPGVDARASATIYNVSNSGGQFDGAWNRNESVLRLVLKLLYRY